jgi:hypothetical protein
MTTISTFHESTFAYFKETTHGQGPGYTTSLPYGTQAGWEAAELAGTADRLRHYECDPTGIVGVNIDDPAMVNRVFAKNSPITGLAAGQFGPIVLGLTGSGSTTADTNTITETPLMTFLEHALGGMTLGTSTTVGATVVSASAYDFASATGQAVGQLVAIEDAGATGTLYFQRIQTLSGSTATFDAACNFTPVQSDICHAVACFYPDADDLACDGTDYSTLSCYVQKGTDRWQATGCKMQLDSISMARGEQPKFNFSAFSTNNFPPSGNSIAAPDWTGSVEGVAGVPVGIKTTLRISHRGTATYVCVDAESMDFQAGVPVVPLDTSTQCDDANEGRAGYTTQPGDTTLTVNVFLDADWQDDFDANQELDVCIEQRSAAGAAWCIKLPSCYLMPSPGYGQSAATNMQSLTFVAHEDDTITTENSLTRAKFLIGIA